MAVKATWTQQGLVQDVYSVGSCQHYDRLTRIKPIKFHEQLVERLVSFVIARDARGTLAANSINFIQEDDTGRRLPGLIKEVTHPAGPHTYEHFHEFRGTHTKER